MGWRSTRRKYGWDVSQAVPHRRRERWLPVAVVAQQSEIFLASWFFLPSKSIGYEFDDNFDIVLANINKNILLQEMHQYAAYLKPGGLLLMSGFYTHDIPDLVAHAARLSMKQIRTDQRETWASLLVQKL